MTRKLTIATITSFVLTIILTVLGLFGESPIALMPALFCTGPMFVFVLGMVVGRTSNEFTLVRKSAPARNGQQRVINPARRNVEPLG